MPRVGRGGGWGKEAERRSPQGGRGAEGGRGGGGGGGGGGGAGGWRGGGRRATSVRRRPVAAGPRGVHRPAALGGVGVPARHAPPLAGLGGGGRAREGPGEKGGGGGGGLGGLTGRAAR